VQDYKELQVWKKAMALAKAILLCTREFPKEQQYILVSQMQRAAISVPSNIAEGRTRHSENEFAYFLNIARGSLAELQTQIILSADMEFLSREQEKELIAQTEEIFRMIYGLREKLNQTPKAKTSRLKALS